MKKTSKQKMARLYQGRKTSLWDRVTGRRVHRLSASVTGEGDWEVEVPQIRMSRAFAVMLVLHVIAVGGLFAYRIWGRDEEPKTGADNAQASVPASAVESPASASGAEQTPAATGSAPAGPLEPQKTYTWRAGDSLQLIASRFGVSTSAMREANPEKVLVPGTELLIPRAGRVFGGAEVVEKGAQASAVFDPNAAAKVTAAVEPPAEPVAPRAVQVPEVEEGAVVPEGGTPANSEAVVTAHQVTARPGPPAKENKEIKDTKETKSKVAEAKKPTKAEKPEKSEKTAKTDKNALAHNATSTKNTTAASTTKQAATDSTANKQPARTAGQRTHVVSKGDTVYNLARRYGFSAEEIAKTNGLGGDYRITLGQQLKIPVKR